MERTKRARMGVGLLLASVAIASGIVALWPIDSVTVEGKSEASHLLGEPLGVVGLVGSNADDSESTADATEESVPLVWPDANSRDPDAVTWSESAEVHVTDAQTGEAI